MGMNIKSEQAHQLARELANLTGESLTEVVTVALQERLERLSPSRSKERMSERLRRISLECAPRLQGLQDPADLLYGRDGLPE